MGAERKLTLPGYFEPGQLGSAVQDVIGKEVRVEQRQSNIPGVDLWFDLHFIEPGRSRRPRQIRGHHGHPTQDNGFPGQSYTSLVTGAFGCTDEVLMTLGRRFGGIYLDEDTDEEISYVDEGSPSPAP